MEQVHHSRAYRDSARDYRENWTTGGFVAYLLVLPAVLLVMAAPGVVLGALLGIVVLKLTEQFVHAYHQSALAAEYPVCTGDRASMWVQKN